MQAVDNAEMDYEAEGKKQSALGLSVSRVHFLGVGSMLINFWWIVGGEAVVVS